MLLANLKTFDKQCWKMTSIKHETHSNVKENKSNLKKCKSGERYAQ